MDRRPHDRVGPVDSGCWDSYEPAETIPGETIRSGTAGVGSCSYGASLFEHRHVALRVALAQVRGVCNLVKGHCVEITRLGQYPEDPENH